MIRSKAAALAALIVLAACNAPPPADEAPVGGMDANMTETNAAVSAASNQTVAAWNQEDPMAFSELFTAEAVVTTPDSTFRGKDAVIAGWVTPALPTLSDLRVSSQSFNCGANSCTETGNYQYTMAMPGEPVATPTGTYRTEWVMQDGAWKQSEVTVTQDAN